MSIEKVRNQIQRFVSTDVPGVMAIKGDWGVGKTYTWNETLKASKENGVKLQRYAYVSLFGVDTLDALKMRLFESVIPVNLIGSEPSVETFSENTLEFTEKLGRKTWAAIKDIPGIKQWLPNTDSIAFMSLKKSLICIDDLERRSCKLTMKDILGIVLQLKERMDCKVVLILNPDEKEMEDYDKFREKVVDIELELVPSLNECSSLICTKSNPAHDLLEVYAHRLKVINIRILRKAKNLVDQLFPLLQKYHQNVSDIVIKSVVLMTWCAFDSKAPSIDFVFKLGTDLFGYGDDVELSQEQQFWRSQLNDYDFYRAGHLDAVIASAVRAGFIVEQDFVEIADKLNAEIVANQGKDSLSAIWSLYRGSFDDNKDDLVSGMRDKTLENLIYINPADLDSVVRLLKELGENDIATELMDTFITTRADEINLFDLKEIFPSDLRDDELRTKFDNHYKLALSKKTARETLERIAGTSGWNDEDIHILASTAVEDFIEIFKTTRGDRLFSYVRKCVMFCRISNPDEKMKVVCERTTAALRAIASESDLNKLRVKSCGVDLD